MAPGTRLGSSEHFSLTAILVPDGTQSEILDRWTAAAVAIGRAPTDCLHWTNIRSHSHRLYLAHIVADVDTLHICSAVFSKFDVSNATAIRNPAYLYNWVLRLLIERLSWFGETHDVRVAMHFAQVKGLPPVVIARYLQTLRAQPSAIRWERLVTPAKVNTPHNQRMLQVADTASGAIFAAFEWDDYGHTERHYLEVLKPKMWRPSGGALQSYGLKVSPWPHPRHEWLVTFCRP